MESSAEERLSFISVPALVTSVLLSTVLFAGSLWVWYLLGPSVHAQVTVFQVGTLLFIVLLLLGVMLSLGYSHLWAVGDEVVIRNGLFVRRYRVEQIAGVRLRKGDPWAYLLVKDPDAEVGYVRKAALAIQSVEGEQASRKVRQLRRWLRANGATGVERDIT